MAAYVKYDTFIENVCNKLIDIIGNTDACKAIIHTDAPIGIDTAHSATPDNALSDLQQISGTNGYTTDGTAVTYTCVRTTSTGTVTFDPTADITWTASGGNLGGSTTGRYFTVYDDTSTGNHPICAFDYAATFTVANGETMTLDFGTTLFTLT
jgi:hypothetical protein